jgi:hypothetical protein
MQPGRSGPLIAGSTAARRPTGRPAHTGRSMPACHGPRLCLHHTHLAHHLGSGAAERADPPSCTNRGAVVARVAVQQACVGRHRGVHLAVERGHTIFALQPACTHAQGSRFLTYAAMDNLRRGGRSAGQARLTLTFSTQLSGLRRACAAALQLCAGSRALQAWARGQAVMQALQSHLPQAHSCLVKGMTLPRFVHGVGVALVGHHTLLCRQILVVHEMHVGA